MNYDAKIRRKNLIIIFLLCSIFLFMVLFLDKKGFPDTLMQKDVPTIEPYTTEIPKGTNDGIDTMESSLPTHSNESPGLAIEISNHTPTPTDTEMSERVSPPIEQEMGATTTTQIPTALPTEANTGGRAPDKTPVSATHPPYTNTPKPSATPTLNNTVYPTASPSEKVTPRATPVFRQSVLTYTISKIENQPNIKGYCAQQKSKEDQIFSVSGTENGNDYIFELKSKAKGNSSVIFFFSDNKKTTPIYIYRYAIDVKENGNITGTITDEYVFVKGQYKNRQKGDIVVANADMRNILSQYGINLVFPTATPTPITTSQPTPRVTEWVVTAPPVTPNQEPSGTPNTPNPTHTPYVVRAVRTITNSTTGENDKWIVSSVFDKDIVNITVKTGSHTEGSYTFYDFKFVVESNLPVGGGKTRFCLAYYSDDENKNQLNLAKIDVYSIDIAADGTMLINRDERFMKDAQTGWNDDVGDTIREFLLPERL